jgi:hypothetical protein
MRILWGAVLILMMIALPVTARHPVIRPGSIGRGRSFSSTGVTSAITLIFLVPSRCHGWLANVKTTS